MTTDSIPFPVPTTAHTPVSIPAVAIASHRPDARLQNLAQQCRNGDLAAAELVLHDWIKRDDAPLGVSVLLATLQARRDAKTQACDTLTRALANQSEADDQGPALRLSIALLLESGLEHTAQSLADRVAERLGEGHSLIQWMQLMAVPGLATASQDAAQVEEVAQGLAVGIEVLPSLIEALRLRPEKQLISQLRRAAASLIGTADAAQTRLALCAALAELALLAHDTENAAIWARRAMTIDPFNARMALVINESDALNGADGSISIEALHQVHEAHPSYPDVRAALIRREHQSGRTASARMRLADWLRDRPSDPILTDLTREIAA